MDLVRRLVAQHLPGHAIRSVRVLGEGLDNVAYNVDHELVVRCAKRADPHAIEREARILAHVAAVSPLPVPQPVFVAPEDGCLAYRFLPGVPLLGRKISKLDTERVVAQLHEFLAVLHRTPAGFAERDEVPLQEWLAGAAELFAKCRGALPAAYHGPIRAFLDSALPAENPDQVVFCHNDLGIEHVLVDPDDGGTVTGIIDWSDAALTDPAIDYGLLFRDLGPAALPAEGLRERAVFFARCKAMEDLDFGLSAGRRAYVDNCLTSLQWLF